jgi:hypothetical protein
MDQNGLCVEHDMPRYFFDLETSKGTLADRDGDNFANDDLARDCAWAVLVEHLRSMAKPQHESQMAVRVRDDIGPRFRATISVRIDGAGRPLSSVVR